MNPLSLPRRPGRFAAAALTFLILCVLWAAYTRYSLTFWKNSDHAIPLQEAYAVLHGNPLLHGWVLTAISFYTTELPFYVIAMAVHGFKPSLLYIVPAFVYAATVTLAVWMAGRRGVEEAGPRYSAVGMAVAAALCAFPGPGKAGDLLAGPLHVATVLFQLAALYLVDIARDADGRAAARELPVGGFSWRSVLLLTGAGVLMALGVFGDTLFLFVLTVPLLLVSGVRFAAAWRRRDRQDCRFDAAVIGLCLAATLAGILGLNAVHAVGGFRVSAEPIKFIPLDGFGQNVRWTVGALLESYGADFFGMPFDSRLVMVLLRLILLGLVLLCFWRALGAVYRTAFAPSRAPGEMPPAGEPAAAAVRPEIDRVSAVLAVSMLVNLTSYAFSNMPSGLDTSRYLIPFYVAGAVLVGRFGLQQVVCRPKVPPYLLAGLLGVTLPPFLLHVRLPQFPPPEAPLIAFLEQHGLTRGYGDYWAAAITTVRARNQVTVRQVLVFPDRVHPMLWAADTAWYRQGPVNFLVLSKIDTRGKAEQAQRFFGPASRRYQLPGYTVLVWNHDISPLVASSPVLAAETPSHPLPAR